MGSGLSELLFVIGIGLAIGIPVGIYIVKCRPRAAEAYGKAVSRLSWWPFLLFTAFFGFLAAVSFWQGRPYFAWFFVGFATLEAVLAAARLVRTWRT